MAAPPPGASSAPRPPSPGPALPDQGPAQPDPTPPAQIINTYTEAVQTVDPFKATGKPHTLWVAFAKFYEDNGQLDDVSAVSPVRLACTGTYRSSAPRPQAGGRAGSQPGLCPPHRPASSWRKPPR